MRALIVTLSFLALAIPVSGQATFPLLDDFESHTCSDPLSAVGLGWVNLDIDPFTFEVIDCSASTFASATCSPDPVYSGTRSASSGPATGGASQDYLELESPVTGDLSIRFQVYIPGDLQGEFWFYLHDIFDCTAPALSVSAATGLGFQVHPDAGGQFIVEPYDACCLAIGGPSWTGSSAQGGLFPTDTWLEVRIDWHSDPDPRTEIYVADVLIGEGELNAVTPGYAPLDAISMWRGPYGFVAPDAAFIDDVVIDVATILPVTGVTAQSMAGSDQVEVSWSVPASQSYDSIEVERDGMSVATLPGDHTTFVDTGIPAGPHGYQVRVNAGSDFAVSAANVCVEDLPVTATDLVYAPFDSRGIIDSGTVLFEALAAEPDIDPYLCSVLPDDLSQFNTVWVCFGVRYQVHNMTAEEGEVLLDFLASGTPTEPKRLYIEGSELGRGANGRSLSGTGAGLALQIELGIDRASSSGGRFPPFCMLQDGIQGESWLSDWMGGMPADVNCSSAHSLDTLPPLSTTSAVPILVDPATDRIHALHHDPGGFETIATTVVFGTIGAGPGCLGCDGDRAGLLGEYLDQLLDHDFVRGDANGDGVVNTVDVVRMATAFFRPRGPRLSCQDAADVNDDGIHNVGDLVQLLHWLFVPGSSPPPAPFPACGKDPTGSDGLRCVSAPCP